MVEVNNLTTNQVESGFLKRVAESVLKGENKAGTDLSVALVGAGRMRQLNKRYLGKNRATDVLSFGKNLKLQTPNLEIEKGLGEIVICLTEVKKNARRFGLNFETELARVLIHGILHLLGYDHEKGGDEAERMEKKQEKYLKLCQKAIS